MTTKRSSILTEGLRPEGSSHPLSLTRPLWLKKNRIGRVCARLVNFLISSFACAKKNKIWKNPKISLLRCPQDTPSLEVVQDNFKETREVQPPRICFPQLHELPLNFPCSKILKRLKENLRRVYKLFDFQKEERPPQAGSCYKCLTSVQEDS